MRQLAVHKINQLTYRKWDDQLMKGR